MAKYTERIAALSGPMLVAEVRLWRWAIIGTSESKWKNPAKRWD
jgi:hypothetical protein